MSSQVNAATGAQAYLCYGWESTFNTPVTQSSRNKYFGRNVRATTMSVQSNFEYLYELYQRQASVGRYKQFEGSLSIDSILASPWIFKAALGKVTDGGSAGAYTHTFARLASGTTGMCALPPMTVEAGEMLPSGNVVRTFSGAVVKSLRMSGAVNDWIKLTTDMFFAQEQTVGNTLNTNTGPDSFQPFIFADGTLSIYTGGAWTAVAEIQNVDLTMNNNILPIYGLNSRFAVEVLAQQFETDLKMTVVFKDATYLSDFLGQTALSTATSTGGTANTAYQALFTATDGTKVEFDGTTLAYVSDFGVRGFEPNALILEDVSVQTVDAAVVATDTTQTSP